MSTDTLDDLGRRAAADLNARTRTIDTEAALAPFGSPGGGHLRPGRSFVRPGRPVFLGAAAVLLVVAAVAVGLVASRDDGGDQRLGTRPAAPVDPADYGPVVATIRGSGSPTLRADLHAPARLDDRTEVAVAITGGVAGQEYVVRQCSTGDPGYNPATSCADVASARLGADGAGVVVGRVRTVFGGAVLHLNDCRKVGCVLQVGASGGDSPGSGGADRYFGDTSQGQEARSFPVVFPPGAASPPIPVIGVREVGRDAGSVTVRLSGRSLLPGRTEVRLEGWTVPPSGMFTHLGGEATVPGGSVTVGADGSVDQDLTVPLSLSTDGGVVSSPTTPDRIDCAAPGSCFIRLGLPAGVDASAERLTPEPVPYPRGG